MAANTINILKPSVNNLTVRILVRAAGLDFEELDVWGKTTTPAEITQTRGQPQLQLDERGFLVIESEEVLGAPDLPSTGLEAFSLVLTHRRSPSSC